VAEAGAAVASATAAAMPAVMRWVLVISTCLCGLSIAGCVRFGGHNVLGRSRSGRYRSRTGRCRSCGSSERPGRW
jgi:hypothetical protein